jgi:hypothetical protein
VSTDTAFLTFECSDVSAEVIMNTHPLPSLVCRINQNIKASRAAIEELAAWAEASGSADTAQAVRRHLTVLETNTQPISEALAELIARQAGD